MNSKTNLTIDKVLLIHKKSAAEFYHNSKDPSTRSYAKLDPALREAHEIHSRSLDSVVATLTGLGIETDVYHRGELAETQIDFSSYDLAISVGGDGTVLDLAHYLRTDHLPVLGVNSVPQNSVGYFTHCDTGSFPKALESINQLKRNEVHRLIAKINGTEIPELILNDILFANNNPAELCRYALTVDQKPVVDGTNSYRLRSMGVLAATAAGSTAWNYSLGGDVISLESPCFNVHEKDLRGPQIYLASSSLLIHSYTRDASIFVDGAHCRYAVGLGDDVEIKPASGPLIILGDITTKREEFVQGKVARYQRNFS